MSNIVTIRGIDTAFPSTWDELTERNLLWLAERFPFQPTRGLSWDFFIHLLNLPARPRLALAFAKNIILSRKQNRRGGELLRKYANNEIDIDDDDLPEWDEFEQNIFIAIEALDNFKWLFDEFYMEKCILPKIRHRFKTWHGPDWLLSNVTGDEFDKADIFFLRFMEDKDEADLHRLIACLWRPKAKHPALDDIREPFSEFRIEHHAQKIARWPMKLKIAAFICYSGMRNAFVSMDECKIVFAYDLKKKKSKKSQPQWGKILLRMADNGSLGTHQEVKKAYIHDIVSKLAQLKQESTYVPK